MTRRRRPRRRTHRSSTAGASALGPTTPWWTSNNGTNTSTLYSGAGTKAALTVAVPGGPTGTVFNGSAADFVVSQNGKSAAARFLFATEAGTILGWSPTVAATSAVIGVDRSSSGAVYKGLAVAERPVVRNRLPQRPGRRLRRGVRTCRDHGRVQGREGAEGLRAVRHPGTRGQRLRHLREAGRRREGRRPRTGAGVRRRVHARRAIRRARDQQRQEERAAERAVGPRDGAGRLGPLRRRSPGRQLRRRQDQRLHEARATAGSTRASCASRPALRSRSTGCGRSPSATAPQPARRRRSTSSPARQARSTACSARSRSVEARSWAGSRRLPAHVRRTERMPQDARSDVTTADWPRATARAYIRSLAAVKSVNASVPSLGNSDHPATGRENSRSAVSTSAVSARALAKCPAFREPQTGGR